MKKLQQLLKEVKHGQSSGEAKKLLAGAELIITDKKDINKVPHRESDLVISTEYAWEISALLNEIKEACSDWMDLDNKFALFRTVGEAIDADTKAGASLEEIKVHAVEAAIRAELKYGRVLYLAYGSNMDESQMSYRCDNAELIDKTTLNGYRFALDESCVATIIPDPDSHVEALLWLIPRDDEERLDEYEGVALGSYRKEYIEVTGEKVRGSALVYISNREPFDGTARSGYMERIIEAAIEHGFTPEYVEELKSWCK